MISIVGLENLSASWTGVLAFVLLVFTPGAWIAFGLSLASMPMWARVFTGAALSPFVASAEFYAIRWAGAPFGIAVWILIAINLPAFWLILRHNPKFSPLPRGVVLAGAITIAFCALLMLKPLVSVPARVYSPHAWIYSDPVYMYARGDLNLEDPSLAGVPLRYPVWPALVFQAAASHLLNSPPVSSWVWVNFIWLLLICGFSAGIVKELGGGRLAQASASLWLMLGINPVGYILQNALPGLASHRLFGDDRYTPWVNKFFLFSTMPLGLATIAALLYLLVRPDRLTRPFWITAGFLAVATGLLYPLIFPCACGILGAKALAVLLDRRSGVLSGRIRKIVPLAAIVVISAVVTQAQVAFVDRSRPVTGGQLALSTLSAAGRKTAVSVIVTSVLLVGLVLVFRKCWRTRWETTMVLLVGALAGYALHAVFSIAYWDNEYKFITVVGICLAPFAALATEHAWRDWARPPAVAVLALAGILLFVPFLRQTRAQSLRERGIHWTPVDVHAFYLQLGPGTSWAGVCNAVRTQTPENTVVVVQNSDYYFPELTARSMYVPPADRFYPGVTLGADVLESGIRGNGRAILADRRSVLNGLFEGSQKEESLSRLLALRRPLAIVAESRHTALLNWLESSNRGSAVYRRGGITVWLVPGGERIDARTSGSEVAQSAATAQSPRPRKK